MEDLLSILNKSIKYFEKKGIKNSRVEAEKIIAHSLNIDRISIYTNFGKILTDEEKRIIKDKLINFNEQNDSLVLKESIRDYFEKTKNYLDKKNISESNIITNIIFSKILNVDMNMIFTKYSEIMSLENKEKIRNILKKIVEKKIPIQYIFNEQIFYGHCFYVDKNVLIPRLDTEIVVEKALELISNLEKPLVLDIGTGSGAIAITIALENKNARVLGSDISNNALNIAKKNSEYLEAMNVKFIRSDLFENIDFKHFDLIVSNPPYISTDEVSYMGENVLLHEPEEALFAENEGLYFYYEISKNAMNYLKDGAYLLFEIGFKQAEKVSKILESFGYEDINVGKDLSNNFRYVYGRKKGNNESR